jgi:hypothetical protein
MMTTYCSKMVTVSRFQKPWKKAMLMAEQTKLSPITHFSLFLNTGVLSRPSKNTLKNKKVTVMEMLVIQRFLWLMLNALYIVAISYATIISK